MRNFTCAAAWRLAVIAASACALTSGIVCAAANGAYGVGARVMASPTGLKDEQYWRPCTVLAVHDFVPRRAYDVDCAATASAPRGSFTVNELSIRPAAPAETAGAPAPGAPEPSRSAPPAAAPAPPRGSAIACPAPTADERGASERERAIRAAIRRGFERPAAPGGDGATTVDFASVAIGEPHAYRVYADPDDASGKTIYPVRATFTACTDYAARIVRVTRERAFACYQPTPASWACDVAAAADTNVRDTTQSIDKR